MSILTIDYSKLQYIPLVYACDK